MQTIMIIEDDSVICEELTFLLKNEGYHPIPVRDFTDIPKQVAAGSPDLILLDIVLPGKDGFSLCREIRKSVHAPVIFITGRDSGLDEIRAFSLGGDDYITKPYNIPVMMARIKAVLRRGSGITETDAMEACGLVLNLAKGTVSSETGTAVLSRNELQILACLMEHAGEIVARADLVEMLWENKIYIDDNTLSVNMTRLRGKLEGIDKGGLVKTRRGMGYQL